MKIIQNIRRREKQSPKPVVLNFFRLTDTDNVEISSSARKDFSTFVWAGSTQQPIFCRINKRVESREINHRADETR